MKKTENCKILNNYVKVDPKLIVEETVKCKLSLYQIRDKIVGKCRILEEDVEKNYYVIVVKSGFLKMALAYLLIKIDNNNVIISGYAEEGLIKQGIAESSVKYIKELIIDE